MIKTIKTTKRMDILELMQAVRNGEISPGFFKDEDGVEFGISRDRIRSQSLKVLDFDKKFTVEIEEPITPDTEFEGMVFVSNGIVYKVGNTISEALIKYFNVTEIHALIDGKLQLIWEREE